MHKLFRLLAEKKSIKISALGLVSILHGNNLQINILPKFVDSKNTFYDIKNILISLLNASEQLP